jgi:hypothetical protein
MSKTVYYYDESKNPAGVFYPGVPLADLTEEEYARLSKADQAAVAAHPMYRKTQPKDAAKEKEKEAAPAPEPEAAEEAPAPVEVKE